ncbi:nuclear transport factor 2 family protein [Novosphingobium gossypii]|uniref:nuclear transport factor 2 family protein n=1 Tax=Novosphingobium gossypii TaxID=1604774 RepID=UPI003D1AE260
MSTLEDRIARLEAESQIRQLIARYCFTIDDRDIDAIRALFAPDAVLKSADGVMNATGVDAIMAQYDGRFDVLGPGHHFMHDVQIDFVGDGSQGATGRVIGHAELWRNNQMMVTAIRYDDKYRNTDRGWKFAERTIGFLYYVPIDKYPNILSTPLRNHAYAEPGLADFPERLPTWIAYEQSRGRS